MKPMYLPQDDLTKGWDEATYDLYVTFAGVYGLEYSTLRVSTDFSMGRRCISLLR